MALKLCVLASGSSGNCIYVGSDTTGILVDAGLSCRRTLRRLEEIGVAPEGIQAICLTHEHSDHRTGLATLQRKLGVPLYANSGTVEAVDLSSRGDPLDWRVFSTGSPFEVGDLRLEPFSVPHDSYEPVGFAVSCQSARIGIVTDMGIVTGVIRERLKDCQIVVIEANHDEDLLKDADRPWSLKQRIMGRQGHLSNLQAGELIAGIAGPHLQSVLLAHLSAECNKPDLALAAVTDALAHNAHVHVKVLLTYPDRASDIVATEAIGNGEWEDV